MVYQQILIYMIQFCIESIISVIFFDNLYFEQSSFQMASDHLRIGNKQTSVIFSEQI